MRHVSFFFSLFFLGVILVAPTPSLAHKVVAFAHVENGVIHVEAGFGSKHPCKGARVSALGLGDGKMVHQGVTDDQGKYAFALPAPITQGLEIRVEASPGHAGQWILDVDALTSPQGMELSANPVEEGIAPWRMGLGIFIIFCACFAFRWFKGNPSERWRPAK